MLQVAVRRLRTLFPERRIYVPANDSQRLTAVVPESSWLDPKWTPALFWKRVFPGSWIHSSLLVRQVDRFFSFQMPHTYLRLADKRHRNTEGGNEFRQMVRLLKAASIVAVAGGGFVNELFPSVAAPVIRLAGVAGALRKQVVWFSQGIGPALGRNLSWHLRSVLPRAEFVAVRDSGSADQLRRLGCRESRILMTGDDAFEAGRSDETHTGQGEAIGFNLRLASYSGAKASEFLPVATALGNWALQRQKSILSVPISFVETESDHQSACTLMAGCAAFNPLPCDATTAALRERVRRCRVVVSGSYHAAVFALAQGVPVVALAANPYYEQKFLGLSAQVGPACQVLRTPECAEVEPVLKLLENLYQAAPALRKPCLAAVDEQIFASRRAYARLFEPRTASNQAAPMALG